MKRLYYFLIPAGSILFVILMAGFGGSDLKNSSGAPAGNTNSPGDGQNCTHCMGGTATPVNGWITSNVPVTGYVPGTTYTITVTAPGSERKGFQVSPQDYSGNLVGTLTAGIGTKLVGSNKYVTHSGAKTVDPAIWSFQWTPPPGGAGGVTFYGSIAVGQQNTKTTMLTISQTTVGLSEERQPALSVYPNPAHDRITVSFTIDSPQMVNLDLLNLNGAWILNLVNERCPAGEFIRSFPVSRPAGMYFLKMNVTGKERLSRLIIVD
jgi:hypothetical protein